MCTKKVADGELVTQDMVHCSSFNESKTDFGGVSFMNEINLLPRLRNKFCFDGASSDTRDQGPESSL